MKKSGLILFLMAFAIVSNAQLFNVGSVGIGYVYVGPKLGTNAGFSSTDVSGAEKKGINLGYQFGGVAKLGITEKLSVQGELLYTSKGYTVNNETVDQKDKANYNYIGLPVIAQYAFLSVSGIDLYGSGGFYSNVMTSGKYISENDFENWEEKVDFEQTKRTEFGLSIGAGANIPLSNNDKLNIDLRYSLGLTDVEKSTDTYQAASSSKNRTFEISAIYFVDLTRWVSFKGKSKTNDAYDQNAPSGESKIERD